MAGNVELEAWWEGLTRQERAEAIRSGNAGQLSDDVRQSLEKAGVTGPPEREVVEYLKMRH